MPLPPTPNPNPVPPAPTPQPQQGNLPSGQPADDATRYQNLARFMAQKQGIDPELANRLFSAESSWNPAAKSPKGAIGLGQLMPQTAARLGVDPTNPVANIHGSLTEFKRLLDKYQGNRVKALGAYNAGEQMIDSGKMPRETRAYVLKILQGYKSPDQGPGFDIPKEPTPVPWALKTEKERAADWDTRRQQQASPEYQAKQQGITQDLATMGRSGIQAAAGADVNAPMQPGFTGGVTDTLKGFTSPPETAMQGGEIPFAGPPSASAAAGSMPVVGPMVGPMQDIYSRVKQGDYAGAAGSGLTNLALMGLTEEAVRRGGGGRGGAQSASPTTPAGGGEPQPRPMSAAPKPPAEDTSIQDARVQRKLEESKARQARKGGATEGPVVRGAQPVTDAGQTGATEISGGVPRGTPAAEEPTRAGSAVGKSVSTGNKKADIFGKPAPQNEIQAFIADLKTRVDSGELSKDQATKMVLQKASELGAKPPAPKEAAPTREPRRSLPLEKARITKDSLGVTWAEAKDGTRVSIPNRIPEAEQQSYAAGELQKQREGQAAIRAKTPEAPKEPSEPNYVYRARPVGQEGVPSESHAQAVANEGHAREYAKNLEDQTGKPHEVVRVDLNKVDEGKYERKAGPRGADWIKFREPLQEASVEKFGEAKPGGQPTSEKPATEPAEPKKGYLESRFGKEPEKGAITLPGKKTALQKVLGQYNKAAGARESEILREKTGELARQKEQVYHRLDESRKSFDVEKDRSRSLALIDAIEDGEKDRATRGVKLTPKLEKELQAGKNKMSVEDKALAMELRGLFQDTRKSIQNLGTGKLQHYYENYFPHLWEKQGQGIGDKFRSLVSKRPLEGPKTFLKERSIPTHLEGLDKGLKPVHDNPIDNALVKLHEQNRYLMAHRLMQESKKTGIAKFVKFGAKPPEGWQAVNDKMYTALQYSSKEKGFVIRGKYYMPEKAAKVLNNYLSPGLRGKLPYDLARGFSNALNQAQLGLSGYHFGTTSVNAIVSQFAQGLEMAAPGENWSAGRAMSGLKKMVTSPAAPFKYLVEGARVSREYLDPKSSNSYNQTARAVAMAGGRARMDPIFKNSGIEGFMKAWRNRSITGVLGNALPAFMEAQAKPIMEWTVPTMKLGAFHDMASDVFAKATSQNWTHERVRTEMQKAWDSVDNRFGQVVYDNLGWEKVSKDLSHVLVRSVGWNFGTFRELGGGVGDIAKYLGKGLAGQKPELSHRAAYSLALPITVGTIGAMYHLLHTGSWPKEMKDYFFPKTGQKTSAGLDERVSLPSYMKDVYSWTNHPLQTAINKANPGIESVYQMLNNRDFYGRPIRHIDDPFVKKVEKSVEFGAKQLMPFSIQNWTSRQEKTPESTLETGFGVAPASKEIERSSSQNLDIERRLERKAEGGRQLRPRREKVPF